MKLTYACSQPYCTYLISFCLQLFPIIISVSSLLHLHITIAIFILYSTSIYASVSLSLTLPDLPTLSCLTCCVCILSRDHWAMTQRSTNVTRGHVTAITSPVWGRSLSPYIGLIRRGAFQLVVITWHVQWRPSRYAPISVTTGWVVKLAVTVVLRCIGAGLQWACGWAQGSLPYQSCTIIIISISSSSSISVRFITALIKLLIRPMCRCKWRRS